MDALYLLLFFYMLTAMITFWVLFFRFMGRKDIRRPDLDIDGILEFFLFMIALVVINPIRVAHVAVKAAFWPVTLWFRIQHGPAGGAEDAGATTGRQALVQLPPAYFLDVLERAGRPATPHNLFALQEQIGILFTMKVKQVLEQFGDLDDWNRFVARAGYPTVTGDMAAWPQRVLDALVAWDPDVAPHVEDVPEQYAVMLLESVGGEEGGFFAGPASASLHTATPWKMKGLSQPKATPLAPPSDQPAAASAPEALPSTDGRTALRSHPTGGRVRPMMASPMGLRTPAPTGVQPWGPRPNPHVSPPSGNHGVPGGRPVPGGRRSVTAPPRPPSSDGPPSGRHSAF